MNLVFTIYSFFFLVTALVSFLVAFLAWQRRTVKGARELAWLMIAAGFGAFWIIFETAAPTISEKIFWSKLEYIGGIATPVLYLIFVLRFTGKDKFISGKNTLLLFIIPLITLILTITNQEHNLVWSGFSAISSETNLMEYYHGIGFWIGYIAYTYLMLFLATIFLISFIIHHRKTFRFQGWIVLIGGMFPWLVSIIYLTGNNPVSGLDLTPVSITLSGTLSAYAIFYIRFLDLVPVARETLVETLTDGILALDGQNRIQDINKAALIFLGIPNKNIIGFPAGSSGATVTLLLSAVLDHQPVDQVEIQRNNESKTFSIIKQEIKNQRGSRLVVIRDITEQLTWLKEIRAGEERYRRMFTMFRLMADNTEDFLWAKDLNNRYIFCNKTVCERLLIANSIDEPIGKTDIFFASREREAHPENPDWHTIGGICLESDTITLNEGKPKQFDIFGNVQGKFLFLDVHKAPIVDEQGNMIGIVGTARDVTRTKQLETGKTAAMELLRKSEDNLRRINAEKDKFFSIVSHDLRSPFNGFLGLTEIMAEGLPGMTPGEIQKMASEMRKSAANLFRLLGNLLEWSRMQRGLTIFTSTSFRLLPKITEALALLQEAANKKEIAVSYNVPDDIKVYADENMLGSILRNLVANAVKFTPKGGSVSVSAKSSSGNPVCISISDTGIGMNKQIINNLFNLEISTNRRGTDGELSTGLGLILCKEFVEKHDGKIWAESEEGKGSVFYFTVPYSAE